MPPPPEDTTTVGPTGEAENNEATDPHDTEEDQTSTKTMAAKGEQETPNEEIPHPSALTLSTQSV